MTNKGKKDVLVGSAYIVLFVVWSVLIQSVDVQMVGPYGTKIGFATLNCRFHQLTGVHMWMYTITDWLGLIPVLVCAVFAALGLAQWIKRKSLLKVDFDLIILGIYYAIVIMSFLIFEMIPINFRPILIDGLLEASYPSSTTLLVLSVMPTFIFQVKRRLKNEKIKTISCITVTLFSVFMTAGRLVSGVHWFTDIIGGALLSIGLYHLYKGFTNMYCDDKN